MPPRRTSRKDPALAPYLSSLAVAGFVKEITVGVDRSSTTSTSDRLVPIEIKTSRGRRRLLARRCGSHLDYVVAEAVARLRPHAGDPIVIFAPYVAPPMARFLAERDVNFADLQGNLRLSLDGDLHAEISGRRPVLDLEKRGRRAAGYWTLFALLAKPELLRAPVRRLAEAAGTSKSAAAEEIRKLRLGGLIAEGRDAAFLPGARERLAAHWIEAYGAVLRPKALVGRFRTPDVDPSAVERRIAEVIGEARHAFGGAAAARRLGGAYRSERTVVHLDEFDESLRRALKALPSVQGDLVLLRTTCPAAYDSPEPRIVHPLLAYAEISATAGPADDRLRSAGLALKANHLPWL